jgi:hypothetical protein
MARSGASTESCGSSSVTSVILGPEEVKANWKLVCRGTVAHASTQNVLAAWLRKRGIEPRQRVGAEPEYDIGWVVAGSVWVAEVKSLYGDSESDQLRYGLGQVLEYRERLRRLGHAEVRAALVVE